ncbi:hypothetical protein N185_35270 [Sinorhizobium sp. GW3]|nr:hypothetical protein N185_35270 [Sinorhizobium sp. GW3]
MGWKEILEDAVDDSFSTSFEERDGKVVPTTEDVGSKQAVSLSATFLYADLAGSGAIAAACPWETTAKIIRAFLDCSTRLIRAYEGEIRSFDGDRVMGVFIGDSKNTHAVKCAQEIYYCTEKIIGPKALKKFTSVSNANIHLRCGIGVDTGTARAVRAGIRNNNDLIWIGRAPSMAAKLSDVRDYPYCVTIHGDVYKNMNAGVKVNDDGSEIWESRTFKFAGKDHDVFRSKFIRKPW